MPRGTPKSLEQELRLQMEVDKKEIKRFIAKKALEPEYDSWLNRQLKAEAYGKACEARDEEARKEAGRYLNTAKTIYAIINGYTCQPEETKKELEELLNLMKEEKLPAEWAIKRRHNRLMKEAGYKYNGRTKTWYKPEEGEP